MNVPDARIEPYRPLNRFTIAWAALSTGVWLDSIAMLVAASFAFNATPLLAAAVVVANLLPSVLVTPYVTRLLTRFGAQPVFLASLLMRVVLTIALAYVSTLAGLIALVAIRALLSGFVNPAFMQLSLAHTHGDSHKRHFAVLNLVSNLSKVIAPLIGGLIATWLGTHWGFLGAAIVSGLAGFALINRAIPNIDTTKVSPPLSVDAAPDSRQQRPFFVAVLCFAGGAALAGSVVPVILRDKGLGPELLGTLLSASAMGNIAWSLWSVRSASSGRSIRSVRSFAALTSLSFSLMWAAAAFWPAALSISWPILFLIGGLWSAGYAVSSSTHLLDVYPKHLVAGATAYRTAAQNTGAALFPLVGGAIGAFIQPEQLLLVAALVILGGHLYEQCISKTRAM